MGTQKRLEARLARLEACVAGLLKPEEEQEGERIFYLHYETYFDGGSFEDIPEKDRDPELWADACRYGPVINEMIEEGLLPGSEELLAEGVDFTREEGLDEDAVRDPINRTYDPNTHLSLRAE